MLRQLDAVRTESETGMSEDPNRIRRQLFNRRFDMYSNSDDLLGWPPSVQEAAESVHQTSSSTYPLPDNVLIDDASGQNMQYRAAAQVPHSFHGRSLERTLPHRPYGTETTSEDWWTDVGPGKEVSLAAGDLAAWLDSPSDDNNVAAGGQRG
jgi:hypothetical protein